MTSCLDQAENDVSFEERKTIDSLYSRQVTTVKRKADSLCDARHDELFNELVDSIKQEYIQEIEAIIK